VLKRLCQAGTLALLCCCLCSGARAQDAEVLKSRVLTALRRSTINGGGMSPYRLKASIVLYDGAGKNSVDGTLEILRRDRAARIVITFPDASATYLRTAAKTYSATSGTLPYFASKIVKALQEPVTYSGFDAAPVKLPQQDAIAGRECMALTTDSSDVLRGPARPPHAVCLDRPGDQLRVVFDGDESYLRDDLTDFEQHEVARRLRLRLGSIVVGDAFINELVGAVISDDDFLPTPEMKRVNVKPTRIPGNVLSKRILHHEDPKYPGVARAAHIQGIVILHAIIGKDGHIQDLSVISSPDKILSEASIKAVGKWTYEPYLLNGELTDVETTISVSFALGNK
jgi:TonB family protein